MTIIRKELQSIYDFIFKGDKKPPTFEECAEKFCPDLRIYKNQRLVKFEDGGRGWDWSFTWLCDAALHSFLVAEDPEINLGEIAGKHSEITGSYSSFVSDCEDDPEKIYLRLVKNKEDYHTDFLEVEENLCDYVPRSRDANFDLSTLSKEQFEGQSLLVFFSRYIEDEQEPLVRSYELFPTELYKKLLRKKETQTSFLTPIDIEKEHSYKEYLLNVSFALKSDDAAKILKFLSTEPFIQPETHFFDLLRSTPTYGPIFKEYFTKEKRNREVANEEPKKKRCKASQRVSSLIDDEKHTCMHACEMAFKLEIKYLNGRYEHLLTLLSKINKGFDLELSDVISFRSVYPRNPPDFCKLHRNEFINLLTKVKKFILHLEKKQPRSYLILHRQPRSIENNFPEGRTFDEYIKHKDLVLKDVDIYDNEELAKKFIEKSHIVQIIRDDCGYPFYRKACNFLSLLDVSFELGKMANGLKPVADVIVYSSFESKLLYLLSYWEVLLQIPNAPKFDNVCAFELIKMPVDINEMVETAEARHAFNNSYHTSVIRLYKK